MSTLERVRRSLNRGDLERAEQLLQAAESSDPHARTPAACVARVWLWWWQGRFEEAHHEAQSLPEGPDTNRLCALVAWATGDAEMFERARRSMTAERDAFASLWRHAVDVLWISRRGGRGGRARAHALMRLIRQGRSQVPPIVAAISAEALMQHGCEAEAGLVLSYGTTGSGNGPEDLLLAYVSSASGGQRFEADLILRRIHRAGAKGVWRWAMGRRGMYLLHVLPALLQLVQEAEDERAALSAVCAWARREGGADACGVVDMQGRLLASAGWREARLPDAVCEPVRHGMHHAVLAGATVVVVAPVRHGGATIGAIAIRSRTALTTTCDEMARTLAALCGSLLRARLDTLARVGESDKLTPEIIGRSPVVAALRTSVVQAASTPFPVLVEGPSGTGKELVARAIHRLSARRDRHFCAVNCAALTDELAESELFGYARGAFTGAAGPRAGLFEEAHQGTLFLDEVSELSPKAQAMLLRALQEREIRRLGENTPRPVDVRVVVATNLPLVDAVARGRFREDLLFRLAVARIRVPPLRDRIEDVPLLAEAFWRPMIAAAGKRAVLGMDAVTALTRHDWPGNVRELQNVIAGLAVVAPARGRVGGRHVQLVMAPPSQPRDCGALDDVRRQTEQGAIAAALARHGGRRSAAARDLGLSRQGLSKAIKRLRLDDPADVEGVA